MARTPSRRPRAQERLRRRTIIRRVLLALCVVFLGAAVWYVTRLPTFQITDVHVEGVETLHGEDIEEKVQALLDGTYGLIIPRRFMYTYPQQEIEAAVQTLPRIERATVSRNAAHEITVSVKEYRPRALWCTEVTEEATTGCVYIAENGYPFAEAPALSGSMFMRYTTEGRMPEQGGVFTSPEFLLASENFASALERDYGMPIYGIVETKDGDVRYKVRGGGEIVTARTANIQTTFENLNSVLTSPEFEHLAPGNFSYIDLRFGSKIFVKQLPRSDDEDEVEDE